MANRFFRQSRIFSSFVHPAMLAGRLELQQPVKAFKVTQGLTITAVKYGVAQQAITVAFTAGGTAGAEAVTVSGNAISVQIQSGVSTITQVRTAMNASTPCAALVSTSGTSGSAVSAATAVALAGAVELVKSGSISGISSILQDPAAAGTIIFQLADSYASCVAATMSLEASSAVDLVPQMKSSDVTSAKQIVVRLLAGATATDPSAACFLHFSAILNSSSVS